jgi:molecular chaperone GrpE
MSTATSDRLWTAIQQDVVALIRQSDALKTDAAKAAEKALKEHKQLLLDMIDVLDSFQRVFDNIGPREETAERQARTWAGNFRTVMRVLEKHLKEHGVFRIEAPEGKALPGFHTVVETEEQLDMDDGTILEELQKGYLWHGKVLRAAHVKVVKN